MGLFDELMLNSVDVYDHVDTKQGDGTVVKSPVLFLSGVPCNVQTLSSHRSLDQGQENQVLMNRVYFLSDPGIRQGMLLRRAGRPDMYVLSFFDPSAGHGEVFAAECQERS